MELIVSGIVMLMLAPFLSHVRLCSDIKPVLVWMFSLHQKSITVGDLPSISSTQSDIFFVVNRVYDYIAYALVYSLKLNLIYNTYA